MKAISHVESQVQVNTSTKLLKWSQNTEDFHQNDDDYGQTGNICMYGSPESA